jgi:hypothetical protein
MKIDTTLSNLQNNISIQHQGIVLTTTHHLEEFEAWWNEFEKYGSSESAAGGKASSSMEDARELQAIVSQTLRIGGQEQQEIKKMGPGTLFG